MEYATQFFHGLDGPASMTFLGIVTGFFLLGLLPAGLTYAFRVRDMKRRLTKHISAHQVTLQERSILQGQLAREEERAADYLRRLRGSTTERSSQEAELARLRSELDAARADGLSAHIATRDREDTVQALKNKVASLQGQLSTIRQASRPAAQPNFFETEVRANLHAERAKVEALQERIAQLTADNEALRRQRESNTRK